ncbi:MAG: hypothetical protein JOZ74_08435 [Bradyrhizobium sp.]|nr:hypothetical protein [Bradyrhizobium sp.]
MADDVLEDAAPAPDAGKVKREPPTIDLEATQIAETEIPEAETAEPPQAEADARPEPPKEAAAEQGAPPRPISPWVIAPFSGAVAAALVIAVGWLLGWPAVQSPPAAPQVSAAAVDDLKARLTGLESKLQRPASDPAVAARLDTIERSVASLRDNLADLRAQSERLAAAVNAPKAAPGETAAAPAVDLSAIDGRIDALERAMRAQSDQITAASAQASQATAAAKVEDDVPLRRVIAAALLDVAVRHGDPFESALKSAKALAPDPGRLAALDPFAEKGIPAPPALCRDLLALVPKLSPATETSSIGSGIIDRLQAGASNLVRIERSDAVGNDRSAIVARMTAAALRNDLGEARRELASLDVADRAPAQAWLDRVAARDAALAASRQFAEQTMASLAKSAQ